MHFETIILGETNQTQKVQYDMVVLIWEVHSTNNVKNKIKEKIGNRKVDFVGKGPRDGGRQKGMGRGSKEDKVGICTNSPRRMYSLCISNIY